MNKPPTDLKVLKTIYKNYYDEFIKYGKDKSSRASWNYIPIDINLLATELKTDPDLLFGRLYYYLDKKYRYKQDDGSSVYLFTKRVGGDYNAINFTMLVGVLADLQQSHFRFWLPMIFSTIAITISILGLIY